MAHDLNFWPGLDWRRESTFSPNFLLVAIICLFAAAGVAFTSFQFTAKLRLRARLTALTRDNDLIAEEAERVRDYQGKVDMWRANRAKLATQAESRIVWSRQFQALWSVLTDEIVFNQLSLNSGDVTEEVEVQAGRKKKKQKIVRTRYSLTITGSAYGQNAHFAVTTFSDRLPLHPVIGRRLESRELKKIGGGRDGGDHKTFTIMCTYKPLD